MSKYTLEQLSVNHDYYCSDGNYYSNEANERYETATDFLNDFECADIDMNLVFRWDVYKSEDGLFSAEVFMILQRKGIFKPIAIRSIVESEVDMFVLYLEKHKQKLDSLWNPMSTPNDQ